jgi:hypothetical protein
LTAVDDETEAYLDAMMARINNQSERILDEIGTLKSDFQNTKGFLLEDAIVLGRRTITLEERLSRLERKSPG